MHGLFGMLDNWQTIAKNLSEEYMVYVIDLRDHGKSEHTTDFNYPLLAQDIAEFLEAEWIHKSYIIGHSMGGKTALQLVKDYPELVEKLIVVDIGIKSYKGGHETILEALTSVPIDSVKTREDVDKHLFRYISEPGIRLFLMKNLTR
ncbi:MAG TPA: alpha/beta hydrolase, partial [Saprospirales bacterium]|nr:alpha/beta hydrolase [Saprospirales bacterium]